MHKIFIYSSPVVYFCRLLTPKIQIYLDHIVDSLGVNSNSIPSLQPCSWDIFIDLLTSVYDIYLTVFIHTHS